MTFDPPGVDESDIRSELVWDGNEGDETAWKPPETGWNARLSLSEALGADTVERLVAWLRANSGHLYEVVVDADRWADTLDDSWDKPGSFWL